jgi:hypothetical protein
MLVFNYICIKNTSDFDIVRDSPEIQFALHNFVKFTLDGWLDR